MTNTEHQKSENGRWGRIPAWWLDHPDLDADGFAVLSALSTYADEHGVCWPSQSTLASKLKRSRPTINRILQRLSDLGLVSIERRSSRDGARLSCRYRLRLVVGPTVKAAVQDVDMDDSLVNAPCSPASHEQLQPEHPDSLAGRGRKPVCAVAERAAPPADVPADWMPSADDLLWARTNFGTIDLGRHIEGFLLRCRAHGYRYRDIGAAWRAWLLQDVTAGRAPSVQTASRPGLNGVPGGASVPVPARPRTAETEQTRFAVWAGVAQSLRAAQSRAPEPAFDPASWQQL
nr:helix-turn-helix domain-containing protein [uncultured Azospirillum sp.]